MNVSFDPPPTRPALNPAKFRDPAITARGEKRARVALKALATLWVNTGTLCNLSCQNCYIESSPKNDRLAYFRAGDLRAYLDEIAALGWPTTEIGFTGGEPFMSPDILPMLADALERGHRAIVLTNAMKPMTKRRAGLLELARRHGERLTIRVSLDHYAAPLHEQERGPRTYAPTLEGLVWLARNGFRVHVAGRHFGTENEDELRGGYARLFAGHAIPIDAQDPVQLVLFPEMDETVDVPEITEACWGILRLSPDSVMCASSRMVVRRKGAERPAVVACTLLPYDPQFELGHTLAEAAGSVALNHPHCARFCVLGGAKCSAG
ncbi:MAG: radical SAM protein [Alphaproteobacteria bacterium]|nr:radical SAM protein [Alphaproteobacteria bacterium]